MIKGETYLKQRYPQATNKQIQPNSLDLKLDKIYYYVWEKNKKYGFFNSEKHLPQLEELIIDSNNCYCLEPHSTYMCSIQDKMKISEDIAQFYLPRSSILRDCLSIRTALGDSEFYGTLMFQIKNESPVPQYLQVGERIATAIHFTVEGAGVYDGDYQERG